MVKWTIHAKAQLRHIYNRIKEDSPLYAKRVSDSFVYKTMELDKIPRKGRKVPEINEDVLREIPNYSYRILYEIKSDYIEVLAVIHKRQDLHIDDVPRTSE